MVCFQSSSSPQALPFGDHNDLTVSADAENVDFRNPEAFFHDINSVCGLLKIFFKELPDPLFTAKEYNAFIQAARKSLTCLPVPNFR